MVEFYINNQKMDLDQEDEQGVKLNFQVADIFNLSNVNASYMDSVDAPKTANNTGIFRGLGLVGDTSRVPYEKISVRVKYYGADVITDGWLVVKETSDSYKISVIDGIIDFFKAIENKTMGVHLNLSEIEHEKTAEAVKDSQLNELYRYLVADYGGKVLTAGGDINIDYLTPSIRVTYLLNKIEELTGYKFIGPILLDEDVKDLWLTYPKAPKEVGTEIATEHFTGSVGTYLETKTNYSTTIHFAGTSLQFTTINNDIPIGKEYLPSHNAFDTSTTTQGTLYQNWKYYVAEDGTYRIDMKLKGRVKALKAYGFSSGSGALIGQEYYGHFSVELLINGTPSGVFNSLADNSENVLVAYRPLNQDDVVELRYYADFTRKYAMYKFYHDKTEVKISKTDLGEVDFSDALKDYSLTEFFKEFLWRYGIAPIADNVAKTVYLQTFNEKLSRSNVENWSSKYVKRTNETYNIPTFKQLNKFTHKYNLENQFYNNGSFSINNSNIDAEGTIIQSKIYSASQNPSTVTINMTDYLVPALPVWQAETKESDGVASTSYKTLSNRFYFSKAKPISDTVVFTSELLSETVTTNQFSIAKVADVHFNFLVPKYYGKHKEMLDVFRKHDIELNLSLFDILNISLGKVFYFEQEAQYYILNRLGWVGKKVSKGEFIRVIL